MNGRSLTMLFGTLTGTVCPFTTKKSYSFYRMTTADLSVQAAYYFTNATSENALKTLSLKQ